MLDHTSMVDHTQHEAQVDEPDPGGIAKCYAIACDTTTDFGEFIMPWFESDYFSKDYFHALLLDLSQCVLTSRSVCDRHSHFMCMTCMHACL